MRAGQYRNAGNGWLGAEGLDFARAGEHRDCLMKTLCSGWCRVGLVVLAGMMVAGCATMSEPGGAVAAVSVKASSATVVQQAVRTVFLQDQFRLAGTDGDAAIFDKDGSRYQRLMYGGWDGEFPTERVRVEVVELAPGSYRVRCLSSVVVPGAGSDDEHRRFQLRSPHYQELLNRVPGLVAGR